MRSGLFVYEWSLSISGYGAVLLGILYSRSRYSSSRDSRGSGCLCERGRNLYAQCYVATVDFMVWCSVAGAYAVQAQLVQQQQGQKGFLVACRIRGRNLYAQCS